MRKRTPLSRHRTVKGLRAVKPAGRMPWPAPRRLKGAMAAGLAYERALAEQFPEGLHGQWLEYLDANGLGFAQPDLQWDHGAVTYVLESKLTWVPSARSQLEDLYLPLLRFLYPRRDFRGIIVAKFLTPETPEALVCSDFKSAVLLTRTSLPIFHWLGPRFPVSKPSLADGFQLPLDLLIPSRQLPSSSAAVRP